VKRRRREGSDRRVEAQRQKQEGMIMHEEQKVLDVVARRLAVKRLHHERKHGQQDEHRTAGAVQERLPETAVVRDYLDAGGIEASSQASRCRSVVAEIGADAF